MSNAAPHVRSRALIAMVPLLTAIASCAGTSRRGAVSGAAFVHAPPVARVLTGAEVDAAHVNTLFEALEHLRPEFVRTRGPTPANPEGQWPVVYLNGAPHGDVTILRTIPAGLVRRVEFIRPADTARVLGRDHRSGAILVTTSR